MKVTEEILSRFTPESPEIADRSAMEVWHHQEDHGAFRKQRPTNDGACIQPKLKEQQEKQEVAEVNEHRDKMCIAKDILPMAIVEKPGSKMLEPFDPRYQLPLCKYISQETMPSLCNSSQASVTSMLQGASNFCSTSQVSICSPTFHFISEDWRLQSKCLQTLFMPADHNGENLAESMNGWMGSV